MKRVIAIDPGSSSGAIAVGDVDSWGKVDINVYHMPGTPTDIYNLFVKLADVPCGIDIIAYMENVGTVMRGDNAASASTFAIHRGHLDMALIVCKIPCVLVYPQKWMKESFGTSLPSAPASGRLANKNAERQRKARAKADRKTYIYAQMQTRWPNAKFVKTQADAVAILTWALM